MEAMLPGSYRSVGLCVYFRVEQNAVQRELRRNQDRKSNRERKGGEEKGGSEGKGGPRFFC